MNLYPAIDLKDGRCVRLLRGDMAAATVFNDDPTAQAEAFAKAGCRHLHIVDLDGAVSGKPANSDAVNAILSASDLTIQLGGGVRDEAAVDGWLERGLSRVILGTLALRQPELVRTLCRRYPDRIAVGIDARGGLVAVEGWTEQSDVSAVDLALMFEDAGVAAIIYTDIDRDGAMQGSNVEQTARLAERLSTPVIASGGVTDIADLMALKAVAGHGIEGVIVGRAIYDGAIDITEALECLAA
jgi:phosphoribosylformimino-5-aminoimidazole carboxamide ribotide isomerase